MQVRLARAAAWLALVLLAGCAGGDAERQALVDQEIKDCVDGFSKSRGGAAGLDGQLICECAVGKLTANLDLAQLRTMTQQTKASEADLQTMGGCVVEEAQRKGMIGK